VLADSVIVLYGPSDLKVVTDRRVDAVAQAEDLATREHAIGSPEDKARVDELVTAGQEDAVKGGGLPGDGRSTRPSPVSRSWTPYSSSAGGLSSEVRPRRAVRSSSLRGLIGVT
jgi:hypothetical protein